MVALAAKIMGDKEVLALHLDIPQQAGDMVQHTNIMALMAGLAAALLVIVFMRLVLEYRGKVILVALVILKIPVLAVAAVKGLLVHRDLALMAELAAQVQLLALVGHQGL